MVLCTDCRFYSRHDSLPGYGACRRYAPRCDHSEDRLMWPRVEGIDSCGEGESKDADYLDVPITLRGETEDGAVGSATGS